MDERLRKQMETRIARLEQQIKAFKDLHASELQLILDELSSFRAELAALAQPSVTPPPPPDDPGATPPRRAAWLAEEARKAQERRAPLSRRDCRRGGNAEEPGGAGEAGG